MNKTGKPFILKSEDFLGGEIWPEVYGDHEKSDISFQTEHQSILQLRELKLREIKILQTVEWKSQTTDSSLCA